MLSIRRALSRSGTMVAPTRITTTAAPLATSRR